MESSKTISNQYQQMMKECKQKKEEEGVLADGGSGEKKK